MIELAFLLTFKACIISAHKCAEFPVAKEFSSNEECMDAMDHLSERAYQIVIASIAAHNQEHPDDLILPTGIEDIKVFGTCTETQT